MRQLPWNRNSSRLIVDVSAPVARIALRNPPLNVIDIPMMEELAQALQEIEARPDISVVVLTGEGKAFSAGVDVAAHTPDKVEIMLLKFHASDSRLDRQQESNDRCRARTLSGWRRGTGDGLRYGVHDRFGTVGISRDQARAAIRRWPVRRWPRWSGRSGPRN